ncbi:unnamed protein product [Calypogeia fissa]
MSTRLTAPSSTVCCGEFRSIVTRHGQRRVQLETERALHCCSITCPPLLRKQDILLSTTSSRRKLSCESTCDDRDQPG